MCAANESQTLRPFLEGLSASDPLSHLNLTVVPIAGNGHPPLAYTLAADAIEADALDITEVSEDGSVPELLVVSKIEAMVLLLDGEELIGAKQNRILNTSILLPPHAKANIPVSCVEQGRWGYSGRKFRSGGTGTPSSHRGRKSRHVTRNLRRTGRAASDQGEVWADVRAYMERTGTASPTGSMHDAFEQCRESLNAYVEAMECPQDARGVVVAIDGKFVALDLFDKPDTLHRVWKRLVTGYAMDAILGQVEDAKPFAADAARALLAQAGDLACEPCPSVGVGDDWRFESKTLVGQALVAQNTCVHLSVFPNDADDTDDTDPDEQTAAPIQSPSQRRTHQGGSKRRGWLHRLFGGE